ncbi:MAG: hypothetical protein PHT54_01360 [Candidatus Nanoarchaeia archaeon]|nr:hypothetical protein [Candidatus Nanoarchaeia archaeon]
MNLEEKIEIYRTKRYFIILLGILGILIFGVTVLYPVLYKTIPPFFPLLALLSLLFIIVCILGWYYASKEIKDLKKSLQKLEKTKIITKLSKKD